MGVAHPEALEPTSVVVVKVIASVHITDAVKVDDVVLSWREALGLAKGSFSTFEEVRKGAGKQQI